MRKNNKKNKKNTLLSIMPNIDSPKNWTEDYKHENGNYLNNCTKCKENFLGHKRRFICKECFKDINKKLNVLDSVETDKVITPVVSGSYINTEIYKCFELLSNSVGETITEYHWREFCGLMKMMEDEKMVNIEWKEEK